MRRTVTIAAGVAAIWWLSSNDDDTSAPAAHDRPQAGVLTDGFTVLHGPRGARHIHELDGHGNIERAVPLRMDRDLRLVGTRRGSAVGWQDGKKVQLALVGDDGTLEQRSTWGKNVRQLCDGAASNDHRFGVGWLESDGRVWFVHGPLDHAAAGVAAPATLAAEPAGASWCGIASAERNVALLWREGSRLLMNFCTAKKCTSLVVKVPLDRRDTLLGYGCVRDSCLFGTRDKAGNAKLYHVTEKGKAIFCANARADATITRAPDPCASSRSASRRCAEIRGSGDRPS
jgi:hypothetical protein